jgi:hypothetical protein
MFYGNQTVKKYEPANPPGQKINKSTLILYPEFLALLAKYLSTSHVFTRIL